MKPTTWRFRAGIGVSALALMGGLTVVAGSQPAKAAGGWTFVASPNAVRIQSGALQSIDCVSATACMAVGDRNGLSGGTTYAERWDGTRWTITPTPDVGSGLSLDAVACA